MDVSRLQRGELVAVAGGVLLLLGLFLSWYTTTGLVLYNGVIDQPATSRTLTSLEPGWYVAIAGTLLMLAGSAVRSSNVERRRKPPGTL